MNNVRMIRDMQRKNRMIKQAEEVRRRDPVTHIVARHLGCAHKQSAPPLYTTVLQSHAGSSKYKMPRFRNVKSKVGPMVHHTHTQRACM